MRMGITVISLHGAKGRMQFIFLLLLLHKADAPFLPVSHQPVRPALLSSGLQVVAATCIAGDFQSQFWRLLLCLRNCRNLFFLCASNAFSTIISVLYEKCLIIIPEWNLCIWHGRRRMEKCIFLLSTMKPKLMERELGSWPSCLLRGSACFGAEGEWENLSTSLKCTCVCVC